MSGKLRLWLAGGIAGASFALGLVAATTEARATFPGVNGRIAFGSDLRPGVLGADPQTDVFTILPDGTERVRLTDAPGADAIPDWSPGGGQIAFTSLRDGNPEIYVMNADGSAPVRITNHPASDSGARWSPDGTQLVFGSSRTGNPEIFLMNADGTGVTQVTDHPSPDTWGDFSPDGSRIAFASLRSGASAVYTMKKDGSDLQKLTPDAMNASQPDWSPDGTRIAFVNNVCSAPRDCEESPHSDIFVRTLATGEIEQITNRLGNNLNPEWSPDGTMIAFWHGPAFGFNNADIFVMNADGTGITNVTKTPSLREYVPAWGASAG